jgi:hypothetical protein
MWDSIGGKGCKETYLKLVAISHVCRPIAKITLIATWGASYALALRYMHDFALFLIFCGLSTHAKIQTQTMAHCHHHPPFSQHQCSSCQLWHGTVMTRMGGRVGRKHCIVITLPIVRGILPSPWMTAASRQRHGRTITSSSNNNLVATSPLPSKKIQGVCHGAASGCSVSGHVLCAIPIHIAIVAAVACPPPLLP